MAGDIYQYDPSNGFARWLEGDSPGGPYTADSLLEGYGTMYGYSFLPSSPGSTPEPLGRQGDVYINVRQNGQPDIVSFVTSRSLNREGNRLSLYAVQGDVAIAVPGEGIVTLNVERTYISGIGERVYTYIDDAGFQRYERLVPGSGQYEALLNASGGTLRPATSAEAERQAVAGYIRSNYRDIIERFAGQLAEENGTSAADEFSNALTILMNSADMSMTYSKWTKPDLVR